MPYMIHEENGSHCVHKQNADGSLGEKLKCYPNREAALAYMRALYANVPDAAKNVSYAERQKLKDSDFVFPDERAFYIVIAQDVMDAVHSWGRYKGKHSFEDFKRRLTALAKRKGFESSLPKEWGQPTKCAIKAVGDWELDVTAIPFGGLDSDRQYFDENTDIMEHAFQTPLITYQHGISGKSIDPVPEVIGNSVPGSLQKLSDGWHLRVILDKTKELAKRVWEAAQKGMAAVSSDSVGLLARLQVGTRNIFYEKNRPGRIAVWPLAGVSLWELDEGNLQPASRRAVALPVMKALYREAGLTFPDVAMTEDIGDGEAEKANRARIRAAKEKASQTIQKLRTLERARGSQK